MIKLLTYYISHAFVNSIKKLFHTWVIVFFLVCFVFGMALGIGGAVIAETLFSDEEYEEELPEDGEEEINEISPEVTHDILDMSVLGVTAVFFIFAVFSADKPGMFNMADVNILFAAPIRPQTVLLFKTLLQMGLTLLSTLYIGFQIPSLIVNAGLPTFMVCVMFGAFIILLVTEKLVTVFLYTVTANSPNARPYLRKSVYALIIVCASALVAHKWVTGGTFFDSARAIFANEYTVYIPLIGWIKGIVMYTIYGDYVGAGVVAALTVLAAIFMIVFTWRMNADFYEDAIGAAQKQQDELKAIEERRRIKKARSEKIKRDVINSGNGASMFFFKNLANRFRFAHFGVFTKTSEVYIIISVGVSLIVRYVSGIQSMTPLSLIFMLIFFFRSYMNPLSEELSLNYIYMIPERPFKKLVSSLLAGELDNFLDFTVPYAVSVLIISPNTSEMVAWYLFLITFEMAIGCLGAFLALSISTSLNKAIMNVIQMMLKMVIVVPYVFVLVLGVMFDMLPLLLMITAVLSIVLSFILMGFSTLLLVRGRR